MHKLELYIYRCGFLCSVHAIYVYVYIYIYVYTMYTCRCVCMSVYYEEDILWYSTMLTHHNKSHKTKTKNAASL